MDLEKAARRIFSLKTFNPHHQWSLRDRLIHEQLKKIYDREASITFRKNIFENQKKSKLCY